MSKIISSDQKKFKSKYKDRSRYPHITDQYEKELQNEFEVMLVQMSKDFGQKLNTIL